ncbi:hypothetical protein B2M20_10200 [Nitrobacter vulgaris]|uniref:Uncharacterized protein n=1 Tax=Nitrobacter vulgaris TaxID=29421 RepID=A0A1V4HYE5_NITVU|nr:hypothetical protein B2M20_10200 [Nitrobacter vulgaris]
MLSAESLGRFWEARRFTAGQAPRPLLNPVRIIWVEDKAGALRRGAINFAYLSGTKGPLQRFETRRSK